MVEVLHAPLARVAHPAAGVVVVVDAAAAPAAMGAVVVVGVPAAAHRIASSRPRRDAAIYFNCVASVTSESGASAPCSS